MHLCVEHPCSFEGCRKVHGKQPSALVCMEWTHVPSWLRGCNCPFQESLPERPQLLLSSAHALVYWWNRSWLMLLVNSGCCPTQCWCSRPNRVSGALGGVEEEVSCVSLHCRVWDLGDLGVIKAVPVLGDWVLAEGRVMAIIQISSVVL